MVDTMCEVLNYTVPTVVGFSVDSEGPATCAEYIEISLVHKAMGECFRLLYKHFSIIIHLQ